MLFLKKRHKSPNNGGPWPWCDANEELEMLISSYPGNAGGGTLADKARNLLSKDFIQQVYEVSYKECMGTNMTDAEIVLFEMLPKSIKRIQ